MITKEELEKYQIAYSQGTPLITDEKYDNLLEEYVSEHGENSRPFTRQKQSSSVNDIVGTIPKTYGVTKPMREGQKIYSDWVRLNGLTHNDWIYLQCKFDGCSVAYDCKTQRFFTRGDYDNGESVDVTELFSNRIGSDEYLKYWDTDVFDAVKFEAIIHPSVFYEMKLNEQYKRPRDMVSATITSRNVEMAKYITLVPLRKYLNGKQYICHNIGMYLPCDAYEEIEKFISDVLGNNASSLFQPYEGYACDGVVATVVTNDTDEELSTEIIPGKEVAIKILNNIKETTLKNVDFQFGRSGRITPVAIVEPVMFDNVKVDHIGLSTFERVVNMNLRHGDTVRVVYNIVPYLIDSYHDGMYPIQIPQKCPICGSPFDLRVLKTVRCTNPNCKGLRLGSIVRYCEKMKMFGVSKGNLTRLYDAGLIQNIPDLYRLNVDDIANLPGFGQSSAMNIINAIKTASTNVSLNRWLGALPMRDTSAKIWDAILKEMFGNDKQKAVDILSEYLNNGCPEDLINNLRCPPGIGGLKVMKIAEGLRQNWDEIKDTIQYIKFDVTDNTMNTTKGKIAMTGTRDKQLTGYLISRGYDVCDFNTKIKCLIVPNKMFTSNKTTKAKELGIPIYTIDEAYEVFS